MKRTAIRTESTKRKRANNFYIGLWHNDIEAKERVVAILKRWLFCRETGADCRSEFAPKRKQPLGDFSTFLVPEILGRLDGVL